MLRQATADPMNPESMPPSLLIAATACQSTDALVPAIRYDTRCLRARSDDGAMYVDRTCKIATHRNHFLSLPADPRLIVLVIVPLRSTLV